MEIVTPTPQAVAALWSEYVAATGVTGEPASIFTFGDSQELADELTELVLTGPKRATAGLLADFEAEGEPVPQVGDHAVISWGDGRPAGVLLTTDVRVGPLSSVDEQFAWDEGEGDRTLAWWQDAHERYFRRQCDSLGVAFHDDIEVSFERFDLVWPR